MTPTQGRTPRTDGPFMVEFRSGWVSGPFKRDQLRWGDEGSQWCVVAAEKASDGEAAATWNPKSGGY